VTPDFSDLWRLATPWREYLKPEMEYSDLWRGIFERVVIPDWASEGFRGTPVRKLLVLATDWCGDAANTVPVLAGLAERVEGLELRVLDRDQFPLVMARYLTEGSRSIPIAIALDASWSELGHWGPRPAALQAWMQANKATVPTPRRYAYARKWYAQDRGETTLRELLCSVRGNDNR
jgi:thioredoxin family protein